MLLPLPELLNPGWAHMLQKPGWDVTGKVVGVLFIIMLSCDTRARNQNISLFLLEDNGEVVECFLRLFLKLKMWLLRWNDKYPCQWLHRIMTDCSAGVCPSLTFPSRRFFNFTFWLHVCQTASKPQWKYEKMNGFSNNINSSMTKQNRFCTTD